MKSESDEFQNRNKSNVLILSNYHEILVASVKITDYFMLV